MAFADLGQVGTASNTGNNQATTTILTTASCVSGELVVVLAAVDNNQTTDGDATQVSDIIDSGGNTWTRAKEFANGQGSAQAGAEIAIFYSKLTNAVASGGTIRATFTSATTCDASALTARRFSMGATKTPVVVSSNTAAVDAASNVGSLVATTAAVESLRVRGIASEANVTTVLTPTSTWTIFTQAISGAGTSATEMGVRGEFKIATSTNLASAPTGGAGAVDHASAVVAFVEKSFDQTLADFRFYENGTEAGSTASAPQGTNIEVDGNVFDTGHLRIRIQESGGVSGTATDDWKLQVSEAGGTYTDNPGTMIEQATAGLAGGATTERLTGGTGSFVAGVQQGSFGGPSNFQLTANNFTEGVWGFQIIPTTAVEDTTVDLKVVVNVGAGFVDLTTLTVIPRLTIRKSNFSQDAFRFYEDGTESGAVAIAAQNTNISRNTTNSPQVQVRFRLQENNTWAFVEQTHGLQVSKNSGAFVALASSDWAPFTGSALADNGATTNRLGAGTGSFFAGLQEDQSGITDVLAVEAGNFTEIVFAIEATGAGAFVGGNTYDFRMISSSKQPDTLWDSYTQIPRITIVGSDAPGSTSGASVVTGVGASTAAAAGSATGASVATASGTSVAAAVGSATGLSTLTGRGAAIQSAVGSTTGASVVTGRGAATTAAAGSASGASVVTATAASQVAAAGSAAGASVATGRGAATQFAVGNASGASVVTGVAEVAATDTTGSTSGASVVTAVSAPVQFAVGTASGASVVTGISAQDDATTGSATGASVVTGVGAATVAAAGFAIGTSTPTAVGAATQAAAGSTTGASVISAVGAPVQFAAGTAAGASVVTAVGGPVQAAAGSTTGASVVTGHVTAVQFAAGNASGASVVTGVGAADVEATTGSASGASVVEGRASAVQFAVGNASGASVVTAVGEDATPATGGDAKMNPYMIVTTGRLKAAA